MFAFFFFLLAILPTTFFLRFFALRLRRRKFYWHIGEGKLLLDALIYRLICGLRM